jgi:hypothetical protein
MIAAARTSEPSVYYYQTTRRYNPEDSHLLRFLSPLFILLAIPILHHITYVVTYSTATCTCCVEVKNACFTSTVPIHSTRSGTACFHHYFVMIAVSSCIHKLEVRVEIRRVRTYHTVARTMLLISQCPCISAEW